MRSDAADTAAGTDPAEAAANSLSKWGGDDRARLRHAMLSVRKMTKAAVGIKSEYQFENSVEHLLMEALKTVGYEVGESGGGSEVGENGDGEDVIGISGRRRRRSSSAVASESANDAVVVAKALAHALHERLRIETVQHLITAFSTPSELEDIRALIKGRTFTALKAAVAGAAQDAIKALPKVVYEKQEFNISLVRLDLIKLTAIDHLERLFECTVFAQFLAEGAAVHPTLSDSDDAFPFDARGDPTFRPSAAWYMNQMDWHHTVHPVESLDHKVLKSGNDLLLTKRIHGTFRAEFDLHQFPFDAQRLNFTLAFNCANEGKTPIVLTLDPDLDKDNIQGFTEGSKWRLDPEMDIELTTVGSSPKRRFPAVSVGITVRRRPQFYLFNVAIPVGMLSLVSLLGFATHPMLTPERLDFGIGLTLTLVAYKFAIGSTMPEVAYLTTLDKFMLLNALVVILFTLLAGLTGFIVSADMSDGHSLDGRPNLRRGDRICLAVLSALWLLIQIWFVGEGFKWLIAKRARELSPDARQAREEQRDEQRKD